MSETSFFLLPRPPFRLDLTVWTLRRRPDNAIDRWDGDVYRRVLSLPTGPVGVSVRQVGTSEAPKLKVTSEGQPLRAQGKAAISSLLRRLLGLDLDTWGLEIICGHGYTFPNRSITTGLGASSIVGDITAA